MARFCNKCGAPLDGIFCVKCGADSRLAASPQPRPATSQSVPSEVATLELSPVQSAASEVSPQAPVPPSAPLANSADSPAARFCNKCGAPSSGTAFCNQCGANMRQAPSPPSQLAAIPVQQTPPPPVASAPAQVMPAQTSAKGSPLTKILIGFAVVVITVGALAAGGVYYVVYRVKQKVHEVAQDVSGLGSTSNGNSASGGGVLGSISKAVSSSSDSNSSGGSDSNGGISGDPCRLLSKEEVGRAIGVEIVAAEASDSGCSYLAQGNSGDMTAKHMAAMVGKKGVDAKTQQTVQNFSGELFKAFQSEDHDTGADKNGNVPVFGFSVDNHAAEAQMRLNAKVFGSVGPGQQGLPGIGDQAMDESGAMMMVRKGDKLIRIMYSTCPCSVDAIKPLAKTLADRL
jgi:hypothetical protein